MSAKGWPMRMVARRVLAGAWWSIVLSCGHKRKAHVKANVPPPNRMHCEECWKEGKRLSD